MFALAIFGIFAVYVVISLLVTFAVAFSAQKRGRRGWAWGLGTAFVMYNLVFWDWLPTVYVHKYYCEKESGFWVYKTLEQWKVENPGVMKTLVANKGAPSRSERFDDGRGETDTYLLNDRFNWIVIQQDIFSLLPIIRTEQQVKDVAKNEVLARYVDFGAGNSVKNTIGPPGSLKFWLHNGNCIGGGLNKSRLIHFADDAESNSIQGERK